MIAVLLIALVLLGVFAGARLPMNAGQSWSHVLAVSGAGFCALGIFGPEAYNLPALVLGIVACVAVIPLAIRLAVRFPAASRERRRFMTDAYLAIAVLLLLVALHRW